MSRMSYVASQDPQHDPDDIDGALSHTEKSRVASGHGRELLAHARLDLDMTDDRATTHHEVVTMGVKL